MPQQTPRTQLCCPLLGSMFMSIRHLALKGLGHERPHFADFPFASDVAPTVGGGAAVRPLKLCVPAQGVCCSPHPRGAAGGTCGLWEGIGTRGWSPQDAVGAHMTEVPGLFGGVGPLQHRLWEELPHLPESTEPFSAQLKTLPWSTCHSSSERELPAPGACGRSGSSCNALPPHSLPRAPSWAWGQLWPCTPDVVGQLQGPFCGH